MPPNPRHGVAPRAGWGAPHSRRAERLAHADVRRHRARLVGRSPPMSVLNGVRNTITDKAMRAAAERLLAMRTPPPFSNKTRHIRASVMLAFGVYTRSFASGRCGRENHGSARFDRMLKNAVCAAIWSVDRRPERRKCRILSKHYVDLWIEDIIRMPSGRLRRSKHWEFSPQMTVFQHPARVSAPPSLQRRVRRLSSEIF
jgi:hypothetical protein